MKTSDFQIILDKRLSKIESVLGNKAREYSFGDDRLHNFSVAARIKGETKAKALWGMAAKHLVSVVDLVEGRLKPTEAMVDEKIGDLINYLILLEAVLKEKPAALPKEFNAYLKMAGINFPEMP